MVTLVIYFFRDVVTLAMQLGISIASIVLLKKRIKINEHITIISHKDQTTILDTANPITSTLIKNTSAHNSKRDDETFLNKVNRKLTKMVVIMCIFSIIEHISFINCTIIYSLRQDVVAFCVCFFSNFSIALKHFSNFFLFLSFNSLFLEEFRNIFKKRNH